jgi:hypothetical protein
MSQMDIDTPVIKKNKGKGKEKVLNITQELDNLPWVEKYRPKTLEELVSHEDITSTSKTKKKRKNTIDNSFVLSKFLPLYS